MIKFSKNKIQILEGLFVIESGLNKIVLKLYSIAMLSALFACSSQVDSFNVKFKNECTLKNGRTGNEILDETGKPIIIGPNMRVFLKT